MVSRKTSLPYPASPPTQNNDPFAPSHLDVDTTDVPPVHSPAREDHSQQTSSYMDSDNPWQDHTPSAPAAIGGHRREHSLTKIPQALRPGGSGQDTPRSSIDSGESRDWWDDDEGADGERSPRRSPVREIPPSLRPRGPSPSAQPPSPSAIKRKPVGSSSAPAIDGYQSQHEFASNNPFRRPSTEAPPPPALAPPPLPTTSNLEPEQKSPDKGKTPVRNPEFSASITDFSQMSIHSGQIPDPSGYDKVRTPEKEEDDPWKHFGALPPPPPQAPAPPLPSSPPPPLPPSSPASHNEQQPYKAVSNPAQDTNQNPWASQQNLAAPPAFPGQQINHTNHSNESLQHEGSTNAVPLQQQTFSQQHMPKPRQSFSEPSLLDDEDEQPPQQANGPSHSALGKQPQMYAPPPGHPPEQSTFEHDLSEERTPPTKPPRPAVVTAPLSAAEIAKNTEYRNETYQIKHFNWFDHVSGRLRRSSMLTQNKNGPCPLLALVNALILGANHESQAALDDALRDREQVSLGLIIETLMYELVDRSATVGQQLPDVDELNAFLLRLRTGMNANPRFIPPAAPAPNLMDARNSIMHLPQAERSQSKLGTFEATGDMKLYGAFSVPLIHGWLPEPNSEAARAFARSAQTYEDAQAIQFGEEELEYKLTRDGLNPDEQRVWEDITSIKNFFKLHPTQLTLTGLQNIKQSLQSGSFAIMFRNDHFSTVYKHPQSGELFILVTDQGYADRAEIVWESLVDISGRANDFFSGDFMPVSHQQNEGASSARPQHLTVDQPTEAPMSPQEVQEQHDADFAMALQMQEEEEQRQRADQARRRRSGQSQGNAPSNSHSPRGSQGNIPITLHPTRSRQSNSDAPENRPTIPARNRPNVPTTNRPTDATDEDAPPAYEEAAKGKPYIPPVGSPLHPNAGPGADGASPMSSTGQLSGTVSTAGGPSGSAHPPGPNAPYYGGASSGIRPSQGNRVPSNMSGRVSAYNEQSGAGLQAPTQQMPGAYNWDGRRPQQGQPVSMSGRPGRQPGQERDCVVM